ncbi:hypothetical protein JXB01_04835 [Candidatus Micrarchaeota archaeon]|nr:hypothetical protein [Candidatus Micrarchaeota archaeon]
MALMGLDIAVTVVTIFIILSGILIGIGRALSIKRIELFGIEELLQSIINGALIGAAGAIVVAVDQISSDYFTPYCEQTSIVPGLTCVFQSLAESLFLFLQHLTTMNNTLGYYQSLVLEFGSFSIQPFMNLSGISSIFGFHILLTSILLIMVDLNIQILSFISENALGLIFSLGLIFRSFFATRKLGGFLIALALGLYVLYPSLIMVFPPPIQEINNSTMIIEVFNNNTNYSAVPILDLNDNYAIAERMDLMSVNQSFVGNVTYISERTTNTISQASFYSFIAPVFSLIITVVFVRELGSVLGGDITLPVNII